MNLGNNTDIVEELQRQLHAANSRNTQLEQLLSVDLSLDPSILGVTESQTGFQLPNYGINSSSLSRSKSTVVYPSRLSMMDQNEPAFQAHKRQRRAFSQQALSTQTMSRSMSNRSESQMPFIQTGPVAPLTNPAMDRYYSSHDEPANQSLQGGSMRLPCVEENHGLFDVGMAPDEFLANCDDAPYLASARLNLSPNDAYGFMPSACPSMISGSSAAETSPLTRQNSTWGEVSMARLASSQSQSFEQEAIPSPKVNGKRPAPEQELFGFGANLPSTALKQYVSGPNATFLPSPDSTTMERSISSTSACSAKSTSSNLEKRAKEFRERVIQNAKATALAPKPQDTPEKETSTSKKEPKVQLHKSSYQRPKHPKVFCDKCNDHPEGFRGDHELRRHVMAKHDEIVRKFVCRDPASIGLKSNVTAINPLDKCKSCTGGKQYGAYYNAAAHLRRTHFRPKTPRGKAKRGVDEKRGGMGGGDWPSMNDLKLWFEEIVINVDHSNPADVDEDELDEDLGDVRNPPIDILGIGNNMMFDGAVSYEDLTVDGTDPTTLLAVTAMPISTPISSASGSFTYPPYSDASPMNINGEYTFPDQTMAGFSSNVSSSNTITPSTFNGMTQLTMVEPMWTVDM